MPCVVALGVLTVIQGAISADSIPAPLALPLVLDFGVGNGLPLHDARFISPLAIGTMTDSIDTGTPYGRFFFNVMASLAEIERE